jgi:hypothetical protein
MSSFLRSFIENSFGMINWEHILFCLQMHGDELIHDELNSLRVRCRTLRKITCVNLCIGAKRFTRRTSDSRDFTKDTASITFSLWKRWSPKVHEGARFPFSESPLSLMTSRIQPYSMWDELGTEIFRGSYPPGHYSHEPSFMGSLQVLL